MSTLKEIENEWKKQIRNAWKQSLEKPRSGDMINNGYANSCEWDEWEEAIKAVGEIAYQDKLKREQEEMDKWLEEQSTSPRPVPPKYLKFPQAQLRGGFIAHAACEHEWRTDSWFTTMKYETCKKCGKKKEDL